MERQAAFRSEYAGKKKRTRRDKFLAEMELVVPWARWWRVCALLPEGRARSPADRAGADAAYLLPAAVVRAGRRALEDALYDSQALRGFTDMT